MLPRARVLRRARLSGIVAFVGARGWVAPRFDRRARSHICQKIERLPSENREPIADTRAHELKLERSIDVEYMHARARLLGPASTCTHERSTRRVAARQRRSGRNFHCRCPLEVLWALPSIAKRSSIRTPPSYFVRGSVTLRRRLRHRRRSWRLRFSRFPTSERANM